MDTVVVDTNTFDTNAAHTVGDAAYIADVTNVPVIFELSKISKLCELYFH